jgi:hypothetical protein
MLSAPETYPISSSIKLYAWEFSFVRKIAETRNNQELKTLKKIGLVTVRLRLFLLSLL